MFENVRHVGHDLKVEDGGAWRRPTYESIVAAQGRGERRERDSSVESDHTTQSDACARKVVVEDDGPVARGWGHVRVLSNAKDTVVEKWPDGGEDFVQRVRCALQGGSRRVRRGRQRRDVGSAESKAILEQR